MHRQFFEVLRGYSALVPPKNLVFPADSPLGNVHDFLVDGILLNPHLNAYPPSKAYQQSFWKWAIKNLEELHAHSDEDFDIDARIYECYMSLLPTQNPVGPPSLSYITHFWKTNEATNPTEWETVTLLESRTTIEGGTTGLRTWTASLVLAQYLVSNQDLIAGKTTLELGCGSGFLGIIAASLQYYNKTQTICLTDINQEVLNRCRDNMLLPCNVSSQHPGIHYRLLDWDTVSEYDDLSIPFEAEVILGADIAFDPSLIDPLVATLRVALKDNSKVALVALTIRNVDTFEKFIRTATQNLSIELIDPKIDQEVFIRVLEGGADVRVFQIKQKASL